MNNMLSLTLQCRKLGRKIKSDMKLKLRDGSEKLLRELFEGKPADLLSAFRATQWTIPAVSYLFQLKVATKYTVHRSDRWMVDRK